ncbi:uncharacterized protein ARMOST_20440 [Armillaria ostoyae]|uniref:Uncharacterized protein n=1 Tax=Armillaria ostoyae TaxID=47428 RepID=A0A284S7D0_ARMOS|nr:uncharacterized protein ARMOST_20440 [Armillaria ostoyae]
MARPTHFLSIPLGDVMNLTPESPPTALDLLHRLQTLLPLTAEPPAITLDTFDVLKRESRPSRLRFIFRDEGFITNTRPLKLHMTLMNST